MGAWCTSNILLALHPKQAVEYDGHCYWVSLFWTSQNDITFTFPNYSLIDKAFLGRFRFFIFHCQLPTPIFCNTQTTVERHYSAFSLQYVGHINKWNNYTSYK